jgi:hypothetical protein
MPDPTFSDALKEAMASAPSKVVIIETLEFLHPALEAPLRLCKTLEDMTLGLENDLGTALFTACGFSITPPSSGEVGAQELGIGVPNVDLAIGQFIDAALSEASPVQVIMRYYNSNDLSQPQNGRGIRLFLYDVVITAKEVTGRATFTEIINRRWPLPDYAYSKTRFPALRS